MDLILLHCMLARYGFGPPAPGIMCNMWALSIAPCLQIVGDRYGVGIDDTHVRLRGAPVLDEPALDVHQQASCAACAARLHCTALT